MTGWPGKPGSCPACDYPIEVGHDARCPRSRYRRNWIRGAGQSLAVIALFVAGGSLFGACGDDEAQPVVVVADGLGPEYVRPGLPPVPGSDPSGPQAGAFVVDDAGTVFLVVERVNDTLITLNRCASVLEGAVGVRIVLMWANDPGLSEVTDRTAELAIGACNGERT